MKQFLVIFQILLIDKSPVKSYSKSSSPWEKFYEEIS